MPSPLVSALFLFDYETKTVTFIGGDETIRYGGVQCDVEIEVETPSG